MLEKQIIASVCHSASDICFTNAYKIFGSSRGREVVEAPQARCWLLDALVRICLLDTHNYAPLTATRGAEPSAARIRQKTAAFVPHYSTRKVELPPRTAVKSPPNAMYS